MKLRLERLIAAALDDRIVRFYENHDGHLRYFSGSGRSFSRDDLIQDIERGEERGDLFYYAFLADDKPIGTVKIGPIDRRNLTSDLVTLIGDRDYLGRGLGAEAVRLGTALAFDELGLRRLHSGVYEANQASVRAYIKGGWFVEARMRGFYLVDGKPMDRIAIACLNPRFFPDAAPIEEEASS